MRTFGLHTKRQAVHLALERLLGGGPMGLREQLGMEGVGLRWAGVTIRSHIDALVAAVAIRLDVPVLHHDRDYDQITQHTGLRTVEM